jgi:hypothetical protein
VAKNNDYLRYLHEFAFSLSLAIVVVWGKSATSPRFVLLERVKSLFPPHEPFSDNHAAGYPAFAVLVAILATCIFLVLRALARWAWTVSFLRWMGGIVALMAVPGCWFYIITNLGLSRYQPTSSWLLLEGVVIIPFGLFCLHTRRPIRVWTAIVLLVVHYALWSRFLLEKLSPDPLTLPLVLVGPLSGLAWMLFLLGLRDVQREKAAKQPTLRPSRQPLAKT